MAENMTKEIPKDVSAFIERIPDEQKREDAKALCGLIERALGEPPRMWGSSIVGFGRYRYRYDSGREGEAGLAGFSPRAKELVVYLPADAPNKDALLAKLGKHKIGKSCLYLKRLADVDEAVLAELVRASAVAIKERYPD
ncbi:MAG TPA: DUF1801 domain-containing protein [Allosphingosinicella sp.]|jgi:hypothetical protein